MVLLVKDMNLINQILMKRIIYSMILLKIVEINIFHHLKIDVFMVIKVKKWKKM